MNGFLKIFGCTAAAIFAFVAVGLGSTALLHMLGHWVGHPWDGIVMLTLFALVVSIIIHAVGDGERSA